MCGNENMFSSLDKTFTHSVKLGNNTRMRVSRKGTVKLFLKENCYTIGEVYWAPELKNNLLSVGKLQEKGVDVLFKNEICSLMYCSKMKYAVFIIHKKGKSIIDYECKPNVHFAC